MNDIYECRLSIQRTSPWTGKKRNEEDEKSITIHNQFTSLCRFSSFKTSSFSISHAHEKLNNIFNENWCLSNVWKNRAWDMKNCYLTFSRRQEKNCVVVLGLSCHEVRSLPHTRRASYKFFHRKTRIEVQTTGHSVYFHSRMPKYYIYLEWDGKGFAFLRAVFLEAFIIYHKYNLWKRASKSNIVNNAVKPNMMEKITSLVWSLLLYNTLSLCLSPSYVYLVALKHHPLMETKNNKHFQLFAIKFSDQNG